MCVHYNCVYIVCCRNSYNIYKNIGCGFAYCFFFVRLVFITFIFNKTGEYYGSILYVIYIYMFMYVLYVTLFPDKRCCAHHAHAQSFQPSSLSSSSSSTHHIITHFRVAIESNGKHIMSVFHVHNTFIIHIYVSGLYI